MIDRLLYLAALFHDIGKKPCSRVENGIIIAPKHAVTGARMFREQWYRNREYAAGLSWDQLLERMIKKLELPEPWEAYRVTYDCSEKGT